MNVNSSFNERLRLGVCGLVGLSSLVGAFYGCSSSSSTPVTPVQTPDGGEPDSSVTPVPDSGNPTPEAGNPGDGGSLVLQKVTETKLFADTADAGAQNVDPNLLNPWGLAFNPSGPAWVSNNHAGLASVYQVNKSTPLLNVTVPLPADAGGDAGATTSSPSGQIFNPSADFKGDKFIFCTEDGTISGWQPVDGGLPTTATLRVDSSPGGAVYKGVAIVPSTPQVLLATDFHNNKIDAFNADYTPVAAGDAGASKWVDPSVPSGYAPFNVVAIGTKVYVVYAKPLAPDLHDNDHGPGTGAISVFDLTGTLVKSLVKQGGALDAPWGLTAVPAGGWGAFPAGALLVADFGDGVIHAFDSTSGALLGTLVSGAVPLIIDGLWAIEFGAANTDAGESTQQLYFTAGPNMENNGLFGYLTIAP